MSLLFASASSQYLSQATALVTTVPCSFACWYKPTTLSASQTAINVANNAAITYFGLFIDTTDTKAAQTLAGTGTLSAVGGALSTGTWFHIASVFTSSTSLTVYVNGTPTTQTGTATSPSSLGRSLIGALNHSGTIQAYADAVIAYPAMWKLALSQPDVSSLYAGASPRLVHPEKLSSYARLVGSSPEPDLIFTGGWTLNASPTVAANPLLYSP